MVFALAIAAIYAARIIFRDQNEEIDTEKLTIAGILFVIITPIMIIRLLRRQKKAITDYSLVIDTDTITAYPSLPGELTLSRIEITQIVKNTDGSYLIIGNAGKTVISVPAHVENPDRLEASLNTFAPIAVNPTNSFIGKYFKVILLAIITGLIAFIYASGKVLVSAIGAALTVTLIGITIAFFGKNTDAPTRRIKAWLIFITICIVAKMAWVLFAK